jgi:dTDP-4-dehydrorhamnose reductase
MSNNTNVLVLGASGMLGSAVLRLFSQTDGYTTTGTLRSEDAAQLLPKDVQKFVVAGIDVEDMESLKNLLELINPEIVINCIGLVKQLSDANNPLAALPINSLYPHKLAMLCVESSARLIHISTDCVFAGTKGMYTEDDITDAQDLYGISKRLGEVDCPNAITLRTSIIGHELKGNRSLINWFLAQAGPVKGFKKAIFSGLPTIELAKIIRDYVIPNPHLTGVFHVSAAPINKYDLLCLVAAIYEKDIEITEDNEFEIDRSLDSSRFRNATGFNPPTWPELIASMREFNKVDTKGLQNV